MTFNEFDVYQQEIIQKVLRMKDKGREYAYSEKDRFQNFNELAAQEEISRLKVASIYMKKHLLSLQSYINKGVECSEEKIEGRIVDIITYLTLIAGMIKEDQTIKERQDYQSPPI